MKKACKKLQAFFIKGTMYLLNSQNNKTMQIEKFKDKTLIIAEIGPNHNGSLKTAIRMIKKIASAGADVIKFQLANPEHVYSLDAFKAEYQKKNDTSNSILEMSKKNQLKKEDHIKLKKTCIQAGVAYACSAFDLKSLKYLDKKVGLPFFKVPSGEILSFDMLSYMSQRKKKIFVSTGMATFKEISYVLNILKKNKVVLMHCVSSYPAKKKNLNLNVIDNLRKKFKKSVGYSDHSLGTEACLAAVAKRVSVIEKHVTLSKKKDGPDHKSSMEIDEFKKFVKKIRDLEAILGLEEKVFTKDEINVRNVARKSIVTARKIYKDQKLKVKDFVFKRPGNGISPLKLKKIIGRFSIKNIEKDKVLKITDIA